MTENDLLLVEGRLGLKLPASYRALHHDQVDLLQRLDWSDDAINPFYTTSHSLVDANLVERQSEMGTAYAFPAWWETFVLIGTNGGGDYYCLRLDNLDGVWLSGSDCGDTPTQVADSLKDYVDQTIISHEEAKTEEAERICRHAPYQKEIDAHLAMISSASEPLQLVSSEWNGAGTPLAASWMTCDAIYPLFEWLKKHSPQPSPRKLRLFGLALCRHIEDIEIDADLAAGFALAKELALGSASENDITQMRSLLRSKVEHLMNYEESYDPDTHTKLHRRTGLIYSFFQDDEAYYANESYRPKKVKVEIDEQGNKKHIFSADDPELRSICGRVGNIVAGYPYGAAQAPEYLREVLGNPFYPATVQPAWRTQEVLEIAETIYREEQFELLPNLAAALISAGCTDERIITHCQRPNDHVRGCWVVDLVLGKD